MKKSPPTKPGAKPVKDDRPADSDKSVRKKSKLVEHAGGSPTKAALIKKWDISRGEGHFLLHGKKIMVCLKALGLHKANHDDHVLTRIIYDPNDIIEVEDEFKTVVGQRLIKGEIQKDLEYRVTEEEL